MSSRLDDVRARIAASRAAKTPTQEMVPARELSPREQRLRERIAQARSGAVGTGMPATGPAQTFEETQPLIGAYRPALGEVVREVPRAVLRGAGQGFEAMADVVEAPLTTPMSPAGFAGGLPGLGPEPTREEALTFFRRNPPTQESAGDRLRAAAATALGLDKTATRQMPRTDNPFVEGLLSGAEALGAGAIGGGLLSAPARVATTVGAIGAGTGRALAEALDLGDTGTAVAEALGEVAGGLSPAGKRGIGKALQYWWAHRQDSRIRPHALEAVDEAIRTWAPEGVDVDALYQQARERLAAGEVGTLGTVLDSPGARGLEEALVGKVPGMRPQLAARGEEVRAQALARLRAAAPQGDPTRAIGVQQEAAAAARLRATQAEEMAQAPALAAREGVGRAAPPEVAGARLAERVDAAREAKKLQEADAWAKVPVEEVIETGGIKEQVQTILAEMPGPERRQFETVMKRVLDEVDALGPEASGAELISLDRVIRETLPDTPSVKPTYGEATKTRISQAVLEALDAHEPLSDAFATARQVSKERIRAFDTGIMGRARVGARDAPEKVLDRLVKSGTDGGAAIRAAKQAGPEVEAAARDALLARYNRAAYDDAGTFRERPAKGFLEKYGPALDEFPELRDELRQAVKAESTATGAGRLRAAEEARIAGTPAAMFSGQRGADAAKQARRVLNSEGAPAQIDNLMSTAAAKGPEAVEDLRRAFFDAFMADAVSESGFGRKLTGDTMAKLARDRELLSQVLTPEQLKRMEAVIEPLERLRGTLASGIEVPQYGEGPLDVAKQMAARMGMVTLAGSTGVNSLIAANIASSQVQKYMRRLPQKKLERLLGEYVMNPQQFLDDLGEIGTKRLPPEQVIRILDRVLSTTAVGTAAVTRFEEE